MDLDILQRNPHPEICRTNFLTSPQGGGEGEKGEV